MDDEPWRQTMSVSRQWWEEGGGFYDNSFLKSHPGHEYPEFLTRQVDFLERTLCLKKSDRILDVACGGGQVSLELARRGYRVTGVDINRFFLRKARRDAKKAGVEVNFVYGDMRFLPFDEEFSVVISVGSSVGHFREESKNLETFAEMARVLCPKGRFLIETWPHSPGRRGTPEKKNQWKQQTYDGGSVSIIGWVENNRAHVHLHYKPSGRRVKTDYRMYSTQKLNNILRECSLSPTALVKLDWWQWQPVPEKKVGGRRVIVARK